MVRLLTSVLLFTLLYGGVFSRRFKCRDYPRRCKNMLLDSNHKLTVDFIKAIQPTTQNFVMCPVCIQVLGTIAQEGANGNTANEIAKVLYQTQDKNALLPLYKELLTKLNTQSRNVQFATRMFVNKTVNVVPLYYIKLLDFFMSDVVNVDFTDVIGTTDTINYWVRERTKEEIPEIFSRGVLKPNEKMVIVNAVFFKDSWLFPFDLEENEQFYESPEKSVECTMIVMKDVEVKSGYSENLKANLVELPFKTPGTRIVILLPKAISGLEEVESKLDHFDIFKELPKMTETFMNVYIPDLTRRNNLDLTGVLKKLGMVTAFGGNADFSDMSPDKIHMSKVVQKVFVRIDAEGATGAAARYADDDQDGFRALGLFRADHPYLFYILHEDTILFVGRVAHF